MIKVKLLPDESKRLSFVIALVPFIVHMAQSDKSIFKLFDTFCFNGVVNIGLSCLLLLISLNDNRKLYLIHFFINGDIHEKIFCFVFTTSGKLFYGSFNFNA